MAKFLMVYTHLNCGQFPACCVCVCACMRACACTRAALVFLSWPASGIFFRPTFHSILDFIVFIFIMTKILWQCSSLSKRHICRFNYTIHMRRNKTGDRSADLTTQCIWGRIRLNILFKCHFYHFSFFNKTTSSSVHFGKRLAVH